ncbi:MAG: hypothetical protein ACKPBB_21040 [Sphaerospermopsis kisseleviana]
MEITKTIQNPCIQNPKLITPDSCKGVREACWKHQHSGDKLSILITGYFPVKAKHSGDKLSILITGYFPVRAKHSGDQFSILITGYFPNASPLLRPYDS